MTCPTAILLSTIVACSKGPVTRSKQVSRYLYHATFCIMILVSLHTKSSSMFRAEFVYKLFSPKWRILTMKTLSYKNLFLWPNNITTFFPFPAMFYLTCADHVLLFVDDVVTFWPQTKISDWSEIKCIVILLYRIEHAWKGEKSSDIIWSKEQMDYGESPQFVW